MSALEFASTAVYLKTPTHLEHLDESDTQIQICHVTADQAQTEEDTNWEDGAEVHTTGHFDGLAAIQQVGGSGKKLGHDGREGQVPCCKDDR